MQHEGSFHLDEVRHLQDDEALRTVLGIKKLPQATTPGDWLRRMGSQPQIQAVWVEINKVVLMLPATQQKSLSIVMRKVSSMPFARR